jgi:hypothetical protein
MRTAFWISSALLLALPAVASAQGRLTVALPPGFGTIYRHASTYEEGVQRGHADVVRSYGLKNLLDSEAAINWEEARKRYFDNRVYGVQKYFEMREINRQARAAERGPRPTAQQLKLYSDVRKPDQLTNDQLDPLVGAITWPSVLRGDDYRVQRLSLDRLFEQRAIAGFLDGEQQAQVRVWIDSMDEELRKHVATYPPQAYTEAKSFLKSLAYMAVLPPV